MPKMSMAGLPEQDEIKLIDKARRGDLEAFNRLVLRYQDSVYNTAYRIMGEPAGAGDAAQEAFITAFRRLSTFRDGSFRAWLLRIVTNQCYDELRRQKRRPATSVEDLPDAEQDDGPALPDPQESPEQVAQSHELQQAIQDCISSLSIDQRAVLVMSDVEEMNYQEIADIVGANLGTIKSRLSRARASVRQCLQAVEELLPAAYRLS